MIETGLVALILANSELSALIGTNLFPVLMPETVTLSATQSALTWQIVGGSSKPTLQTAGLQKYRIQFDAYAISYAQATMLRDALRVLLNGYQGVLADGSLLQNASLIQNIDFFNNDARQFRCMSEFYIYFNFTS